MNPNQAQGQGLGGLSDPPQARPPSNIFKPEHMRNLPDYFSAEEKAKWESGLSGLWKAMDNNAPDSREHLEARKRALDFSNSLRGKMQQTRAQAVQSRQPNQGAATARQNDGHAPSQGTAQQARPTMAQAKLSEQLVAHINNFPFVTPMQFTAGSPEAIRWLTDAKQKYGKALMAMENSAANLRNLDSLIKERAEQGKPLSENELREIVIKKDGFQKQHVEARRFTDGFRKDQEKKAAEMGQQKAGNRAAVAAQLAGNPSQQQVPNQGQQTTEAMNAAMQAVRNQQMHGVRPPMAGNGQPVQPNDQVAQAVSGTLHSTASNPSNSMAQNVNIKVEGGTNPPQVNTAIATAPHLQQQQSRQQNSPQSAVPQSATSNDPPRPLSHPAALAQAARTYSSTQTSGTPNVMGAASHAHPSVPRETPNINTNKMPIPKQLPPNAIAMPQQVAMPPARPTLTGGPSNAGSGLMGQPVLQKTPGFNLEGEGERVLNKRKLDELVRQVTGGGEGLDSGEGLTPEVEDCVLSVADEFVDQVITAACKCAKARGSKTLEIRDIQLILERNYNIRIPGYASDEIRTVRKFQPAQGWIAKMSAIQAAKVTGGKGDL